LLSETGDVHLAKTLPKDDDVINKIFKVLQGMLNVGTLI